MKFIADLHIHSYYSRATSKEMNIVSLEKYAQLKWIDVIWTWDFTHPKWIEELYEKLEPASQWLFRLKKKYKKEFEHEIPESCKRDIYFMLTAEISTIFKKNDKVRKVHSLIFSPSFESARKINTVLGSIWNIHSDWRPILWLDVKKLLEIMLNVDKNCLFVPAHAWTPHFSIFWSQSWFNTLKEAFEDLTPYIYAIETWLSSDPQMNWRLKQLENIALISNSDAHSPKKLGREANIFNTEISYNAIIKAIKNNDLEKFTSTIEFFPEEWKYHVDWHRKCNIRLNPKETKKQNFLCPKCKKKVTIWVLHRVEDLADFYENYKPKNARNFLSIDPLLDIISEVKKVWVNSKKVNNTYNTLLNSLWNEFDILLNIPIKDIQKYNYLIWKAISKMREWKIDIKAWYDWEFWTINIFNENEIQKDQMKLF